MQRGLRSFDRLRPAAQSCRRSFLQCSDYNCSNARVQANIRKTHPHETGKRISVSTARSAAPGNRGLFKLCDIGVFSVWYIYVCIGHRQKLPRRNIRECHNIGAPNKRLLVFLHVVNSHSDTPNRTFSTIVLMPWKRPTTHNLLLMPPLRSFCMPHFSP